MSAEEAVRAYLQGRIDRREFIRALRAVGVSAGAAVAYAKIRPGSGAPAFASTFSEPEASQGLLALTDDEFRILDAIAARIFPTTETPGAREAGAATYIDIALADAYAPSLRSYRRGLSNLDAYCKTAFGSSFAGLSEDEQDSVLEALEAGQIRDVEGGSEFFQLVRRHVLEGVFCEPIYGGNRGLVGWAVVGFPGQRYGYPDPYINKIVDLPPVAASGMPRKED